MTLRNKDGTIYKLAGPNPAMKDQNLWDEFKTHNMQWDSEKAEATDKVTPISSDFDVRETFLSALDKAKADIKVVETKPEMPAPVVERKAVVQPDPIREEEKVQDGIEKVFIHVLPAYLRERRDALYGDSYKTIQYGKPTSFEGVILEQTDLAIQVWTDTDKIGVGSVLFPKTGFRRWWRVQEKVQKGGGWVLAAMPSDHQPSFDL
jgi:hypothetical protein